jgi:TonB-dependent starch-binding outer membrane protein SusC
LGHELIGGDIVITHHAPGTFQFEEADHILYRTNYLSTAIPEIFAGSSVPEDKDNGGYSDATARCNFFGRINYGYKDKYLAEVTLRYDGSMNFAPGHRWGLFPAFSLGWVIPS